MPCVEFHFNNTGPFITRPAMFHKSREFLDQPCNYQLFKENHASWRNGISTGDKLTVPDIISIL
jgi:hypothetical protein